MATRLYELLPFFCFVQLLFGKISFIGPAETVETLPTSLSGLQTLTILDFILLPVTLHEENFTSTWTLPNGEMVSKENQSTNTNILVIQGQTFINATANAPSTSLLVGGLSYTDAGVYRCSVQDDRNPGSPPIEATIELRLTLTLTAINSSVTILDNASFVELSCDMSNYIRPDDQLQWFRDGEMITSGQARRQITVMNGNARLGQLGDLLTQSSRVSVLTISNPVLNDTGTYNCRVMGTTESVSIELLVQRSETATNPTTQGITSSTPVTELTFPLPALIGGIAGILALIVLILVIVIVVVSRCVAKRKKKNNHTDDPMYDYPDELPPPPLPQPRTNQIQVITNTAYNLTTLHNDVPAADATYETTMNTTNPAYGLTLSASAGISIAVNSAQQQDETPPATNPTFEDEEIFYCPRVTHPTYKEEVYSLND